LGILPNGQYLGIEIKTGKAVQRSSQKKFHNIINKNNGMYLVIRSIEEMAEWILLWKRVGVIDG
jgi:hypothetical protein